VQGAGQGIGLSPYTLGEVAGSSTIVLTGENVPAHAHPLTTLNEPLSGLPPNATTGAPLGPAYLASSYAVVDDAANTQQIGVTDAAGAVHETPITNNAQPFLALTCCIATSGVFPAQS